MLHIKTMAETHLECVYFHLAHFLHQLDAEILIRNLFNYHVNVSNVFELCIMFKKIS